MNPARTAIYGQGAAAADHVWLRGWQLHVHARKAEAQDRSDKEHDKRKL